ncbi:MAG: nicotinate-nucleotide--dimethylbenzimidazole phosphoribosyltransferase [Proteobacteria bacterium]|nr:nicotinate-nucleotide--dimethylbenzimidazole phosphoribosyltransferase [Pseudomonadota bacterium]
MTTRQSDYLPGLLRNLPGPDEAAGDAVARRQARLTKPPGSLGMLEEAVGWLARWQRREMPRLDQVDVVIFAGNHGVTAQGVSPYPAEVTAQMVGNFQAGGAAINQIATAVGATLSVVPLMLDRPTADFTEAPAMTPEEFRSAVAAGFDAVVPGTDLLCLGEMGIGNTTAAAAMAAALFGGAGSDWAGRGTGLDAAGVAHKAAVVDRALALHAKALDDPWEVARCLGGRETAAILGAVLAARRHSVPVLLDGFVCSAAAAAAAKLLPGGLDHTMVGHCSAESGHRRLLRELGRPGLLDLDMRLGEASGATLAVSILRAAVAIHAGMATFAEAGVADGS